MIETATVPLKNHENHSSSDIVEQRRVSVNPKLNFNLLLHVVSVYLYTRPFIWKLQDLKLLYIDPDKISEELFPRL